MTQLINVFVSSTFLDLEDRRRRVIEVIESFSEMKCVAMERFTASTQTPKEECLRLARGADLFVLILAYRYGWIPDGEAKSITQLEHEAAKSNGIPRLVFVVDESKRPPSPDADVDKELARKLREFKSAIDVTPRPFGDDANLVHHVHASVREWREARGLKAAPPEPAREPHAAELSRYREALLDEHRWIRPVGFPTNFRVPIQLDDLFVLLRARARRIDESKDQPEHVRESELVFARPADEPEAPHALAFTVAARHERRALAVLGDPGSGKTTLLRRIANGVLGNGPELIGLDAEADGATRTLPVFVPLRRLEREHCAVGLVDAIAHCLPESARLDREFARWLVEERGHLLVLLDGLDEVGHDLRDDVAHWIAAAIEASPSSRFVVTSRFAGYTKAIENELERVALAMEIQPLDDALVAKFVRNWYAIIERAEGSIGAEERAELKAASLLAELKKPEFSAARVLEMTANPLLLTAICLVHRDGASTLPKDRVRLYAEAIEVLLELWRRGKTMDVRISAQDAKQVLQPVAYFLHSVEGRTEADESELTPIVEKALAEISWSGTAQSFLRTIRDESGLLAGLGGDRYGFLHLGFQEYLAARHVQQTFAALGFGDHAAADKLLAELADRFGLEWWQELWLLVLALSEQPRLFVPLFAKVVGSPRFVESGDRFLDDCLRDTKEPRQRQALPFTAFLTSVLDGSRNAPAANLIAATRAALRLDPAFVVERARALLTRVDGATGDLIRETVRTRDPALFEKLTLRATEKVPARAATTSTRAIVAPLPTMLLRDLIEMVQIPAGKFRMGGTKHGDEQPIHEVTLRRAFWLARTPITNEQYKRFVEAASREAPASWRERRFNAPEQPVVTVDHDDARAFCAWLDPRARLPSEAEWEYACRAGTDGEYSFGNDEARLPEHAWFVENSGGATRPVGEKPANPLGLFDMHGNVREWCADTWHGDYNDAPNDGSAWEGGGSSARVVRGGSWDDPAGWCRSAYRFRRHPGARSVDVGFRPAMFVTD